MQSPSRALFLLLTLLLAASLASCIHYVPREEESTPTAEETSFAETTADTADTSFETDANTDAETEEDATAEKTTESSEPDTAYPNEPDDEHSKRY